MLKEAKKVYFIGIGGIGVSAIARLCIGMGKEVSGSDIRASETTDDLSRLGAGVAIGHSAENLEASDVVVYTEDISPSSKGYVELEKAGALGIPTLPYSKALGEMMDESYSIGVTGTNGKSTTTAILGLIIEAAKLDPTVVVGSKISAKNSSQKFKANARLGTGRYFVAEADEYHRHMLDCSPNMIVLTNVAEDHLDYYKDLAEIKGAFAEYVGKLPPDGMVIYNADDRHAVEIGRTAKCHKFTFGIDHYADLQAVNLKPSAGVQHFDLHFQDALIGQVSLKVPGKFNVENSLGAALAALKLGVTPEIIINVLNEYAGIWRRFEIVGQQENKIVISDYGHHPAGVAGTIQAAKEFFPGKKILAVFQPHHRNRTKALFNEFVHALSGAEEVIIPEIFDVAGREHGEAVSSKLIVEALAKEGVKGEYAADLSEAEKQISAKTADVILLMGAGDIDQLARRIVSKVGEVKG